MKGHRCFDTVTFMCSFPTLHIVVFTFAVLQFCSFAFYTSSAVISDIAVLMVSYSLKHSDLNLTGAKIVSFRSVI